MLMFYKYRMTCRPDATYQLRVNITVTFRGHAIIVYFILFLSILYTHAYLILNLIPLDLTKLPFQIMHVADMFQSSGFLEAFCFNVTSFYLALSDDTIASHLMSQSFWPCKHKY